MDSTPAVTVQSRGMAAPAVRRPVGRREGGPAWPASISRNSFAVTGSARTGAIFAGQDSPRRWVHGSEARPDQFAAIAVVVFLIFSGSLVIIGPASAGSSSTSARSLPGWDEGLHFKIPIYQRVEKMDVRSRRADGGGGGLQDLQDTHSTIAVNFNILPTRRVGLPAYRRGYNERVIDPVTQEVVKAVTARYTAVELITNREKIRTEIKELLKARLLDYHIAVVDVSIVNFKFSAQFTQAIENKQTAEQMALKASRDLDRIKIERSRRSPRRRRRPSRCGCSGRISPRIW